MDEFDELNILLDAERLVDSIIGEDTANDFEFTVGVLCVQMIHSLKDLVEENEDLKDNEILKMFTEQLLTLYGMLEPEKALKAAELYDRLMEFAMDVQDKYQED